MIWRSLTCLMWSLFCAPVVRHRPDGEPHILMDFLTLLGDHEGQRAWKAAKAFVPPPVKVRARLTTQVPACIARVCVRGSFVGLPLDRRRSRLQRGRGREGEREHSACCCACSPTVPLRVR